MTPDLIHDYEYNLQNALSRVNNDPTLRDEDRRLLLAFLEHIKALRVSTGRQAKYAGYGVASKREFYLQMLENPPAAGICASMNN